MYLICVAVASFAVLAQPAGAQGTNTTLPVTYSAQVLPGDGSQTCHSEEQRERVRNEVDTVTRRLLRESVVPLLQDYSCGGSTGWRRVAYLNMADPSQQCPSVWREITTPHRVCEKRSNSSTPTCEGVNYTTGSVQYDQVCGRIIGYQLGTPYAFSGRSIDSPYVFGVSVTHGSPRQHIWTFAAGADEDPSQWIYIGGGGGATCPCVNGSINERHIPSFVGQNYFCETGITRFNGPHGVLFPDGDPLWDGQGCGPTSSCCTFNSPPWFNVTLPSPTTDYIEVRICSAFNIPSMKYADTPIQLIELYVK